MQNYENERKTEQRINRLNCIAKIMIKLKNFSGFFQRFNDAYASFTANFSVEQKGNFIFPLRELTTRQEHLT